MLIINNINYALCYLFRCWKQRLRHHNINRKAAVHYYYYYYYFFHPIYCTFNRAAPHINRKAAVHYYYYFYYYYYYFLRFLRYRGHLGWFERIPTYVHGDSPNFPAQMYPCRYIGILYPGLHLWPPSFFC